MSASAPTGMAVAASTGLKDVTAIPKITERLVKAGYTEAQLANFWGGNALRVLGKAHDARKQA